mgnify:CR=1 FL=1
MLQNTFLHIPGIGETTERKLWNAGIVSWSDFVGAHDEGRLRGRKVEHAIGDVRESLLRYEAHDWNHFDRRLPSHQKWRAFGDLGDRALYVDIETTGMAGGDSITVIGTYDGRAAKSFVEGENLDEALSEIETHPLIVTYNGVQFDMPFIRDRFRRNLFNHVHVDLRFPLRRLGYSGGLKRIERMFGIGRSARTQGLDGWDAVRLWREHLRGSREALDLLLEYNREDIVNLEPLMRFVFGEMARRTWGIGDEEGFSTIPHSPSLLRSPPRPAP